MPHYLVTGEKKSTAARGRAHGGGGVGGLAGSKKGGRDGLSPGGIQARRARPQQPASMHEVNTGVPH